MELWDRVRKKIVAAINEYEMLQNGDRVLVAVSGGKDSTIMLLMLDDVRKRAKINFSLQPLILDQKQPSFDLNNYSQWLSKKGFDLQVIEEDTYSIVVDSVDPKKTFCGLCSRLRRGILYNYASNHEFTKIALGHHREDINETLLMNMFFNGRITSMPPKLHSNDGRNTVIRPLAFVDEASILKLQEEMKFPVIPCNLCGSQENQQRVEMKKLLSDLNQIHPGISGNMLAAQKNITPSQLLDKKLWDFNS